MGVFASPKHHVENTVFSQKESFWKTIRHIILLSPHGSVIFAIFVLLSLFLLIKEVSSPVRHVKANNTCGKVNIIIKGRIRPTESVIHAGFGSSPIRMCFHFPELPLDMEKYGTFSPGTENMRLDEKYCVITSEGNFEARFSFRSRKVPGYFCLRVKGRNIQEKLFEGLPLSGKDPLECTIPEIVLLPGSEDEGTDL